jgi:hypothetical protein
MRFYRDLDGLPPESAFLVASWRELFDPFTPDSFQPRLHNVATLVEELADIAGRGDETSRWWRHARKVRDELGSVAGEESDLLGDLPEYAWNLRRVLTATSSRDVLSGCAILANRRGEYENQVVESAKQATSGLPHAKDASHRALRRLATIAMPQAYQQAATFPEGFTPPSSVPEIVKGILENVRSEIGRYRCVFPVIGRPRDLQRVVRAVGFDLIKAHTLPAAEVALLSKMHPGIQFVASTVSSNGPRGAIAAARRSLSRSIDLFNLYKNADELVIVDPAFWSLEPVAKFETLSHSDQAFRRLHSRKHAGRDTLEAINLVSQERMDQRLLSALELHSIALSVSEPRLKLINLWSALECLSGCCDGDKVIGRVSQLAVDLLVWRRVDKVIRYLAIGTQRLAEAKGAASYGPGFTRSTADYVFVDEMMETLCAPKDSPPIVDLLKFASDSPLLCHRVYKSWHELHSPHRLREKLLSSRRRIEWQLNRIYRARNLLVHHGYETPGLIPLLDNLQYYSSLALQKIIHGMKLDPSWGVRESLEYWRAKSQFVVDMLQNEPAGLTAMDILSIELKPRGPKLWPNAKAVC